MTRVETSWLAEIATEAFIIEAMVHGYHVYQDSWDAAIREQLPCKREFWNCSYFAVAVVKSGKGTSFKSGPRRSGCFASEFCPEILVESHVDLQMKCEVHLVCM